MASIIDDTEAIARRKRKIIQIVPGQYTMTALCDDGTYWKLVGTNDHPDDRKWWELIMKLPDVPQDPDGAA